MDDKRVVSTETTPVVASDSPQDSESQNYEISKYYLEKCTKNEENTQTENVAAIYTEMSDDDDTSERTSSIDVENQVSLATDIESSIDCGKKIAYCISINYILEIIFKKYLKGDFPELIFKIDFWTNVK